MAQKRKAEDITQSEGEELSTSSAQPSSKRKALTTTASQIPLTTTTTTMAVPPTAEQIAALEKEAAARVPLGRGELLEKYGKPGDISTGEYIPEGYIKNQYTEGELAFKPGVGVSIKKRRRRTAAERYKKWEYRNRPRKRVSEAQRQRMRILGQKWGKVLVVARKIASNRGHKKITRADYAIARAQLNM